MQVLIDKSTHTPQVQSTNGAQVSPARPHPPPLPPVAAPPPILSVPEIKLIASSNYTLKSAMSNEQDDEAANMESTVPEVAAAYADDAQQEIDPNWTEEEVHAYYNSIGYYMADDGNWYYYGVPGEAEQTATAEIDRQEEYVGDTKTEGKHMPHYLQPPPVEDYSNEPGTVGEDEYNTQTVEVVEYTTDTGLNIADQTSPLDRDYSEYPNDATAYEQEDSSYRAAEQVSFQI
jgi:hypothetical protein